MSFGESGTTKGLLEYIDEANLPREMGGASPYPLGAAPEEAALYHEVRRAAAAGRTAGPVAPLLPDLEARATGWRPPPPEGFGLGAAFDGGGGSRAAGGAPVGVLAVEAVEE